MTVAWGELADRLILLARLVGQEPGATSATELPTSVGATSYALFDWPQLNAQVLEGAALADLLRNTQEAFSPVVVAMAEIFDDSGNPGALLRASSLAREMMALEFRERELETSNGPGLDSIDDIKLAMALSALVGEGYPFVQSMRVIALDGSVMSGAKFGHRSEWLHMSSVKEFWEWLSNAGWNSALLRASRVGAELGMLDSVLHDTACNWAIELGVYLEGVQVGGDGRENSLRKLLEVCDSCGIALSEERIDSLALLTARTLDAAASGLSSRKRWEF